MSRKTTPSHGALLLRTWRGEMQQVDACKLLDLDPATYCKFESGARRPGGSWAARIESLTQGRVPASSWHHTPPPGAEAEAKAP